MMRAGHLLQVLPSVAVEIDGTLKIDADFFESVMVTLERFDHVSVACPVTMQIGDTGLRRSIPIEELPAGRVSLIRLPNAYALPDFLRYYGSTRQLLKSLIKASEFLLVSPHTLI